MPALGCVQRYDMVTLLESGHTRPHIDHNAGALVAQNGREDAFRVRARQGVVIGMANAGGLDLDQHLAKAGAVQVNGFNGQGGA